jgi:hypothetical protein
LGEVENIELRDYNLKLFSIFNYACLLGDAMGMHTKETFQYKTDGESLDEFRLQIEDAKKRGLL